MCQSCWIVGAGEFFPEDFNPGEDDYIIAADGGYDSLKKIGRDCDMALGDFDSLGYIPDHPNVVRHDPIKDDPDMMLAVEKGLSMGYRSFHLLGGMGGRVAHTLANIQILVHLARNGCSCYLTGEREEIVAVHNGTLYFGERACGYLSVFCFDGIARGVNMCGLKYNLENSYLESGRPLGLSNEFVGNPSLVSVSDGTLVALYAKCPENVASYACPNR